MGCSPYGVLHYRSTFHRLQPTVVEGRMIFLFLDSFWFYLALPGFTQQHRLACPAVWVGVRKFRAFAPAFPRR